MKNTAARRAPRAWAEDIVRGVSRGRQPRHVRTRVEISSATPSHVLIDECKIRRGKSSKLHLLGCRARSSRLIPSVDRIGTAEVAAVLAVR